MFARALGLSLAVTAAAGVSALPALAQTQTPAVSATAAADATHQARVATHQVVDPATSKTKASITLPKSSTKAAVVAPDTGACTTNRQAAFANSQPPMAQSASQPPQTIVEVPVTPTTGDYLSNVQQQTAQRQLVDNCVRGSNTGVAGH